MRSKSVLSDLGLLVSTTTTESSLVLLDGLESFSLPLPAGAFSFVAASGVLPVFRPSSEKLCVTGWVKNSLQDSQTFPSIVCPYEGSCASSTLSNKRSSPATSKLSKSAKACSRSLPSCWYASIFVRSSWASSFSSILEARLCLSMSRNSFCCSGVHIIIGLNSGVARIACVTATFLK